MFEMSPFQLFFLVYGKLSGCSQCITYMPTVQFMTCKLVKTIAALPGHEQRRSTMNARSEFSSMYFPRS